jgi:PAS domain S-box-containing protein
MKSKSNIISFIFIISALFLAIIIHLLLKDYFQQNTKTLITFHFLKDVAFIIITGLIIRIVIERNDKLNINILEQLQSSTSEIKESNERYDIVAKATSDTIWDWKIQEDVFVWNKGIQGIFGYKKEEVGKTSTWWFDRIHPEDSLKMSVKLYSFLEQKTERWQDEYRFKCADGSYKYVFDRGFLLFDDEGKAVRMIGAIQDITKQKEEEQRLKLLETVITQTKDAVVITDTDISENPIPNIIFVNEAFTKMTGYKPKEVIGKSPIMFIGPKSDRKELEKLTNAIQHFKESIIETISYKKNGGEYWVNFSMIPVTNKDGVHTHWISIQRDVTKEKEQQREREQLIRELTQNNKDLKQFSYITSHNFRAPLSNLTGLLNLLDDVPVENEELQEILNGFRRSTELLNETIDDLVKVVIIKDNPSILKESVFIIEIFKNVFFQLTNQINLHKPNLKIEIDPELCITINKAYMESIIINLVSNALKYRSPEKTPTITIKAFNKDNFVNLIIKDNGIGIDLEKNHDKIFGLYQRFHDYPDSKGLGLYLVKSQIEAMGGSIKVESQVNKGTQFTITLKK